MKLKYPKRNNIRIFLPLFPKANDKEPKSFNIGRPESVKIFSDQNTGETNNPKKTIARNVTYTYDTGKMEPGTENHSDSKSVLAALQKKNSSLETQLEQINERLDTLSRTADKSLAGFIVST
jgi:hypothetical protein